MSTDMLASSDGARTSRREGPLVSVTDLTVRYRSAPAPALRGVSFSIDEGEIVGLAGESGSGKSTAAIAMMGLLPHTAEVTGSVLFAGQELVGLPARRMRAIRGRQIAAVFQETTTALNPVVKVGDQLVHAVRAHTRLTKADAVRRVTEALLRVRLTDTDRVLDSYAGQLSGGMSQRVLIAMALGCGSRLLLADEPTTALDVSVQQEILELLREMADDGLSILLISHDLGVLNELTSRLMIIYGGEIVESGPTAAVVGGPQHPYTQALLGCVPRLRRAQTEFPEIPEPRPGADAGAEGCLFRHRCERADSACLDHPELMPAAAGVRARCWHPGSADAGSPSGRTS